MWDKLHSSLKLLHVVHFFSLSVHIWKRETSQAALLFVQYSTQHAQICICDMILSVSVPALTFDLCLLESHVAHTAITPAVVYLLFMCFPAQRTLCLQWPTSRGYLLGWISENFIFLSALNLVISLTLQTFPYLTKVAKVLIFISRGSRSKTEERNIWSCHVMNMTDRNSSFPGSFSVSHFLSLLHWLKTHEGKCEYRHVCLCRVILLVCNTSWKCSLWEDKNNIVSEIFIDYCVTLFSELTWSSFIRI